MKGLKGLLGIVTKNKVKNIEVIGQTKDPRTKVDELYEILSTKHDLKEPDIAKALYPENSNYWSYYLKLKSNLRNRLLNTLFFIDVNKPQYTDIQRAYYNCYKDFAAVRILLGKGERGVSIKLAEKTYKKCEKFEFTELSLNLARVLRMHYSQPGGGRQKYQKYKNALHRKIQTLQAEIMAEESYIRLLNHSGNDSLEWDKEKKQINKDLNKLFKEEDSYRFILFYYYSKLFLQSRSENKANLLKICENAIADLEKKEHIKPKQQIALFLNESIPLCINLRKLKEGKKLAERAETLSPAGTINWYNTLLSKTILHLHEGNYMGAYQTYRKATENENIDRIPEIHQEQWRIIEAFCHFLIQAKKIKAPRNTPKFKVGKFVNQMPIYSQEKRGLNITIIIIQILFLLQQRKFGSVIDKMDSLNSYSHRYLKKTPYFRSNCFLKMLLTLPNSNFNKIASKRKSEKYYKKLQEVPLEKANLEIVPEIIPYEELWELILETLDTHTNKVI